MVTWTYVPLWFSQHHVDFHESGLKVSTLYLLFEYIFCIVYSLVCSTLKKTFSILAWILMMGENFHTLWKSSWNWLKLTTTWTITEEGAVDQRRELKELLLHRQTLHLKKLKQGSWTYQFKIVFSYQRFIVFLVFINLFPCLLYILTICKVPNWIITGASKN